MQALLEERACRDYIENLLGLTNWCEYSAGALADPAVTRSADDLMYLHFTNKSKPLADFLANAAHVAAFATLYPSRVHLLAAGHDMVESCARLHTVRQGVISHHDRGDSKDVQNHKNDLTKVPGDSDQDHAAMMGLNLEQLKAWKSQINEHGFVLLTMDERLTIANAILAEFT